MQDENGNTIWCEQCGEEPATHVTEYANLCDGCYERMIIEENDDCA